MKNRISFNLDDAFKKAYLGHLDAVIDMGSIMIAGTDADDMKGGQNMGLGGGLNFVKDGVKIAQDNRKLIDDDDASSLEEFEKDANFVIFLMEVLEKLTIINAQVNQAYTLVSRDLMEQANWVLDELKKRKKNPVFGTLYERLNTLYKKRAERAAETVNANKEVAKQLAEAQQRVADAENRTAEASRKS